MDERLPVIAALDRVRSVYNVGAFFRTADAVGAERLLLLGYTAHPPHRGISKTALGAEDAVPWEHTRETLELVERTRAEGYQIVCVETTDDARDLFEWEPEFPVCAIFGNEVDGVAPELREAADVTIRFPQRGAKDSLNVAVAGGVVLFELLRKWRASRRK